MILRVLVSFTLLSLSAGLAGDAWSSPLDLLLQRSEFTNQLTQQSVTQTFQDSRGSLWLVTEEGLNKYIGYELENYRHQPSDPFSIPGNIVTRVTEDRSGNIWLSTLGGGIARYNEVTNNFITLSADPNDSNTPYNNDIYTVFTDSRGIIWLGYINGFSTFDPSSGAFRHYISGSAQIPRTGKILDFTQTADGTIWAATETSGLLEIEPTTGNITANLFSATDENSIVAGSLLHLLADTNNHIWIASEVSGVSRFNPQTKQSINYTHSPQLLDSLSSNQTTDVLEDLDGNIWISTPEGLNLYLPTTNSFYRYTSQNTDLIDDKIFSVGQSREGLFWVGTRTGLVTGIKTQFKKFDSENSGLSSGSINAFAETGDGSLWVATDDGLNRLAAGASKFNWINESTSPQISSPVVMSLYGERETLWIGTYDGGLNRLDLNTLTVQSYRHSPLNYQSVGADGITSVFRISSGELLVGTYGGGLSLLDESSDVFTTFRSNQNDPTTLSSNSVLAIYEDSLGYIWVGTENGLNRFDRKTLTFDRYLAGKENSTSLSSKVIWSFFEDAAGNLWMGTEGGGLQGWMQEHRRELIPKFKRYNDHIYLPSASVYGIQQDNTGRLWLSHNKGLTRFDPSSLEAHQYGIQDGLQANEFNLGASFQSANGSMYFGGINGFNAIYPSQLKLTRYPPKVSISKIKVMNERREFDTSYQFLDAIKVGYEDRMLSVEFFAADYSQPEQVNYAYKLEGINPDWVISPDSRIASFTTLPPGEYILKLAAASPDGTWNWNGRSIPIIVAPPPWASPAAYALYLLLAAGLVTYYFHLQRRKAARTLEIQRELETRVAERTLDLEEARKEAEEATQAKSDFLATMSHEIRTPMHGIIGMTELLLHTNLSSQQLQFANAAHKSGESLLGIINEILDFSKVEASKVELESVQFNIFDLIEDICYLQAEQATRKGLRINHICEPQTPEHLIGDPSKLRQVIMNLVSNSIKFTHEGNVNIQLDAKPIMSDPAKTMVHICVEDEGIGMDADTQQKVFEPFTQADTSTTRQYGGTGLGLSISRHYIDLMGGDINVQSAPNKGTRITISVPLLISPNAPKSATPLEGLHADIFSAHSATGAMFSRALTRLGADCSVLPLYSFPETSILDSSIVVFDFNGEELTPDISATIKDLKNEVKVVATSLAEDLPFLDFEGWSNIARPLVSSELYSLLSTELDLIESAKEFDNLEQTVSPNKNILVAEDVATNQRIIQEMLQLLGSTVDIAKNGEVAVKKYRGGNYSLIFMDCQMPILDGYGATEKIRLIEQSENRPKTPIIALTAGSDEKDREKCARAGMDDYLTKPFTLSDIDNILLRHLDSSTEIKSVLPEEIVISLAEETPSEAIKDNSEIFNLAVIESIREVEQQTGKPILADIFKGYREQMSEKFIELDNDISEANPDALSRTAHAIKSMSANIGAEKVRALSADLEETSREGKLPKNQEDFSHIKLAFEEFVLQFEAIVTEMGSETQ